MYKSNRRRYLVLSFFSLLCLFFILKIYEYNLLSRDFIISHLDSPTGVERIRVADVIELKEFISKTPAQSYEYYFYNNAISDKIGSLRALPDTRDERCAAHTYRLPPAARSKVSIVITYHNEARSALIRTIMSVHKRTPAKYLHEIILIDDYSDDDTILPVLSQLNFPPFAHNKTLSNTDALIWPVNIGLIKMQRNPRRLGLIESRNLGARLATGDYLLFLDSHCEVNVGWLEPMLERIAHAALGRSARNVNMVAVSPVLDIIDTETLDYRASSKNLMGGFDWNLHFHWVQRQNMEQNDKEAFRSPVFSGGIFMISRNWFFKLNAFNSLLEIWGGESIEFAIKLWLCGGEIEIVPCSRVGHIFRKQHAFSFTNGDDGRMTYLRNSKIIAESWLDAYKYFFYALKPSALNISTNFSQQTLTELKRKLKCRPFSWYLKNVYTDLKLPNDDFIAFGTLSIAERCLQIFNPPSAAIVNQTSRTQADLLMSSCYHGDVTHWYLHRKSFRLQSNTGACLNVVSTNLTEAVAVDEARDVVAAIRPTHFMVVLQYCHTSAHTQRWLRRGTQLMHEKTHLCLDNLLDDIVVVSHCRRAAPSQLFRFTMELQQL